ncbi:hypothetical protein [Sunxiuqinia sp. sy24]|uniref:hypothetical protein n=1 Tax=Sunxiuqinia sp. sy24 TaxID=3461495 RepID=UPI004045D8D3
MAQYNRGLFHEWVPKPVQLLLILLGLPPYLGVNGVYSGNIMLMSNGLNSITEFFMMANNSSYIGMMVMMPLSFRIKQYFRSKEIVLGSLLLMSFFSMIVYTTDSEPLIIVCTLLIGMVKFSGMLEFLLPVIFIISPQMKREIFYPIFYPIAVVLGLAGVYWASMLAYKYDWRQVYLIYTIYMLCFAALMVIFMHNKRGMKKVPMYQLPWASIILFVVIMMLLNFITSFMKYYDWFHSPVIVYSTIALLVVMAVFVYRQTVLKRPYMKLQVFKKKTVYGSLLLISLMGIFLAGTSVQTTYFVGVLKYSNETIAGLTFLMVPGFIIASAVCYIWLNKLSRKLKELVIMGFVSFLLSYLMMYFLVTPISEISYFVAPNILKGMGMGFLYVALTAYNARNLTMDEMFPAATLFVLFRSFVGTAIFGAVINWGFYKLRVQHGIDLAGAIDPADTLGMMRGGAMRLYGPVQIQALLISAKQMFGFIVIAAIVAIIFVIQHRFEVPSRRFVLFNKRLAGHDIDGYKIKGATAEVFPTVI